MFRYSFPEGLYEVSHKRVEHPTGECYNNHVHSYCEILLFISGNADYNIDGTLYSPEPYDLLLIADAKYHYLIPKDNVPYENYVIGFDRSLISEERYTGIFPDSHIINIRDNAEMRGFFERLDKYHDICTREDFCECARLIISEMLIYLSLMPKNHGFHETYSNTRVSSMIALIDEHITEELNADIIAKKLFLSRSYVQNVFSKVMHIGIKKYINQKKVLLAAKDIEKGMSPKDAAEKYAFSDYSSFYRSFRSVLGASPCEKQHH